MPFTGDDQSGEVEDAHPQTQPQPQDQDGEDQDGEDQDGEDAKSCMVMSSTMALPKQQALRQEWMLDRQQTRRHMEESVDQTHEAVFKFMGSEEKRVIGDIQDHSSKSNRRLSNRLLGRRGPSLFVAPSALPPTEAVASRSCARCDLRLPLNPHSTCHLVWDVLGFVLILHDLIMIPLAYMVLLQDEADFGVVVNVVINTFWTFDIGITFLTARAGEDGELVTNLAEIARQYTRSWLCVDLLMVGPDWISLALERSRTGFATLKFLKVFRAARLLRMIRMERILRKQVNRVNSDIVMHLVHLFELTFGFLMLNHLVACCWYYIGRTTGQGWFEHHVVAQSLGLREAYLLALHWSVTQFHGDMAVGPGNAPERLFAVIILVIGLLTTSVVVSLVTTIMFTMRQAQRTKHEQQAKLRSYFRRHKVPTHLMLSIKAHFGRLDQDNDADCQDDEELLQALPEQLGRSLLFEVRQAIIGGHCLFCWMSRLHSTALRDICHSAFVPTASLLGHPVFECATASIHMYFVESGLLRYIPMKMTGGVQSSRLLRQPTQRTSMGHTSRFAKTVSRSNVGIELRSGCWVCEPALWVQGWQTHGELIATTNSILLCLEGSRFAQSISSYPSLHFDVTVYARWVLRKLRQHEEEHLLDMWAPSF